MDHQPNIGGAPLSHNPNADEAERLRVRETFNLHEHLRGAAPKKTEQQPVHITKEQVLVLCQAYGIDVIQPGPKSGRQQNIEEKYEALKVENGALLDRARLAEASAASAARELQELKDALGAGKREADAAQETAPATEDSTADAVTEETTNA